MKNNSKRIAYFSTMVVSALSLIGLYGHRASAQQTSTMPQTISDAVAHAPSHFDVSLPLSQLTTQAAAQRSRLVMRAPMRPKQPKFGSVQEIAAGGGALMPLISATIGLSFEGVGQTSTLNCPDVSGFGVVPPDTNAAVGDTQVVEWVNLCYAVFDKSTGALVAGPYSGTNFWAGFGGGCELDNSGDIIIQWDKANHRWLASQNDFGPTFSGPYQTCIAVSRTEDARGSYNRYSFPQPGFPDYPKWGLTPNIYYQTQNDFGAAANAFVGVNVCAYQGNAMRAGNPNAKQVCILDNSNGTMFDDSMLPADDDTDSSPSVIPAATENPPEALLGSIDNFYPGDNHVYEYVFTVNFAEPANSILAGIDGSMPISVPAFNLAFCGTFPDITTDCVPQPNPGSDVLDTLGDRLMYRLVHVNRNGAQTFLVSHSVDNTSAVAARWYEFRAIGFGGTVLSLHQSGQTPDDGEYRWMSSLGMDKIGDIAIGYSRSSARPGDEPSIYYAGQTAGDALGTIEAEAVIKKGTGSQRKSFDRWGDYSSMAIDGDDHCTFWYANEYIPMNGSFTWATWLASLKFPNCH
jgi:hypothetical protein